MKGRNFCLILFPSALESSATASKETTGLFQTCADVVVFAAALGVQGKKRVPLGTISKKELAPIALEIFVSRGYDLVLKLIAIAETKDTKIISPSDSAAQEKRIRIFEAKQLRKLPKISECTKFIPLEVSKPENNNTG